MSEHKKVYPIRKTPTTEGAFVPGTQLGDNGKGSHRPWIVHELIPHSLLTKEKIRMDCTSYEDIVKSTSKFFLVLFIVFKGIG